MSMLSHVAGAEIMVPYELPFWQQATMPILSGPLFGSRWLVASGGKVVRLLSGTFNRAQTRLFQQLVKPGSVVFDVGARVGYYTLLSSRLARGGLVRAFETDPRHLAFLRANLTANRCTNVCVHEMAVNLEEPWDQIDDGRIYARSVRLDDFVEQTGSAPTHLRIDVRSAAFDVLKGGLETLVAARPTIFLTVHRTDVRADCCDLLSDLNYDLRPIEGGELRLADSLLCVG